MLHSFTVYMYTKFQPSRDTLVIMFVVLQGQSSKGEVDDMKKQLYVIQRMLHTEKLAHISTENRSKLAEKQMEGLEMRARNAEARVALADHLVETTKNRCHDLGLLCAHQAVKVRELATMINVFLGKLEEQREGFIFKNKTPITSRSKDHPPLPTYSSETMNTSKKLSTGQISSNESALPEESCRRKSCQQKTVVTQLVRPTMSTSVASPHKVHYHQSKLPIGKKTALRKRPPTKSDIISRPFKSHGCIQTPSSSSRSQKATRSTQTSPRVSSPRDCPYLPFTNVNFIKDKASYPNSSSASLKTSSTQNTWWPLTGVPEKEFTENIMNPQESDASQNNTRVTEKASLHPLQKCKPMNVLASLSETLNPPCSPSQSDNKTVSLCSNTSRIDMSLALGREIDKSMSPRHEKHSRSSNSGNSASVKERVSNSDSKPPLVTWFETLHERNILAEENRDICRKKCLLRDKGKTPVSWISKVMSFVSTPSSNYSRLPSPRGRSDLVCSESDNTQSECQSCLESFANRIPFQLECGQQEGAAEGQMELYSEDISGLRSQDVQTTSTESESILMDPLRPKDSCIELLLYNTAYGVLSRSSLQSTSRYLGRRNLLFNSPTTSPEPPCLLNSTFQAKRKTSYVCKIESPLENHECHLVLCMDSKSPQGIVEYGLPTCADLFQEDICDKAASDLTPTVSRDTSPRGPHRRDLGWNQFVCTYCPGRMRSRDYANFCTMLEIRKTSVLGRIKGGGILDERRGRCAFQSRNEASNKICNSKSTDYDDPLINTELMAHDMVIDDHVKGQFGDEGAEYIRLQKSMNAMEDSNIDVTNQFHKTTHCNVKLHSKSKHHHTCNNKHENSNLIPRLSLRLNPVQETFVREDMKKPAIQQRADELSKSCLHQAKKLTEVAHQLQQFPLRLHEQLQRWASLDVKQSENFPNSSAASKCRDKQNDISPVSSQTPLSSPLTLESRSLYETQKMTESILWNQLKVVRVVKAVGDLKVRLLRFRLNLLEERVSLRAKRAPDVDEVAVWRYGLKVCGQFLLYGFSMSTVPYLSIPFSPSPT